MFKFAFVACFAATMGLCAQAEAQSPPASDTDETPKPLELTWDKALALARQSSPAALGAPLRIREAEAARVEASIYPRSNPLLEVELGPRFIGTNVESAALAVGLSQSLDLGGGTGARLRRVGAQVDAAQADADAAMQQTLRAVGLAYVRAQWAEQRLALAIDVQAIAASVQAATKKRVDAGDSTALELNVARGGKARAAAEAKGAEATRDAAFGELRGLLGLPPTTPLLLKGELETARPIDLPALRKAAQGRGDVRALAADVAVAQADEDLADALAAPQLSLGARYEFEDDQQHTILGTLSMTLPIFDHAQGLSAQAEARAKRATLELAAKKKQIEAELDTAAQVAEKRAAASDAFALEKDVATFADNVKLAMRGYEAGETSLGEVLLVRRELIDTEAARLDRLLEQRSAEIDLLFAAGVVQ
ncbi:MAG: TolC family protein [Myxococcales bacterium]|nr:TolC family protein [Myxococcales bacterium]